jgi:hypothetical protein
MVKRNDIPILRATLATALHQLETKLEHLDEQLRIEFGYPQWVWQGSNLEEDRQRIRTIIRAIDYIDEQEATGTRICPAVLGTSRETLDIVHQINQAKKTLQAALQAMDDVLVSIEDPITGEIMERPLLKVALAALRHPRLHRRQATRQLVVLDTPPDSISFTWARLPKIETTDKDRARQLLEVRLARYGSRQSILQELAKLEALPEGENLAIVKPAHVHPRVNLVFSEADGRVRRTQKRGVLPIFYPTQKNSPLVRLRPLADESPPIGERLKRSDVRVDPEVFLPSIHAHRYLK